MTFDAHVCLECCVKLGTRVHMLCLVASPRRTATVTEVTC